MTKKLCGPLAYWQVTKWPATANRFVTPGLDYNELSQFVTSAANSGSRVIVVVGTKTGVLVLILPTDTGPRLLNC